MNKMISNAMNVKGQWNKSKLSAIEPKDNAMSAVAFY